MANKIKSNWLPILLSLVIVALLTMQGARASYFPGKVIVTSGAGATVLPAGPTLGTQVTSSASTNTYGSYVEFRSASGNAIHITGITVNKEGSATPLYVELTIGTGTAASETTVSIVHVPLSGLSAIGPPDVIRLTPWIPVAANTRIAVKGASDTGSSTVRVKLLTIDQANVVVQ